MLSVLIWGPILGAVLLACIPVRPAERTTRPLAMVIAGSLLVWSLWLLIGRFDLANGSGQFQESLAWISALGLNYSLGVDGLSLPLVVLNTLLTWVAIYSTPQSVLRPRLYHVLILLTSAGMTGALVAQNTLLFVLFYELELIPLYLLLAIWGGPRREYAAIKFLIYTALSGILILGAFLATTWLSGAPSFDLAVVSSYINRLAPATQLTLVVVLLLGFGIKAPLVPLHTWLPDAYGEASPPVAMMLGGVLAKLGTYGLVRFGLQLFPDAWTTLAPTLAIWGTVCVLFGALTAIAQKDIKRMVAYSSVGHMGYVLFACAVGTPLALTGAMGQMVAHGLILAILFHLVGVVELKVGTRELDVLNGLLNPLRGLPSISALLVLGGMASAGIPGMVGFVAEFLIFQGSYATFPLLTLLCVAGTGLTAVYFVILLNRTCFGKLDNATAYYPPVVWAEKAPALVLMGLILFLGLQPTWLVRWSEPTAIALGRPLTTATLPAPSSIATPS
ncbi:MAG: NADH-quinone oxidoreductase subunit M [Gloeomargaritaceae cyanobacterium C42_A2020_066]|nr:NADH-quinone oxidoreductase subunit M [Gloeomargaritaceae cyanobacterium C42_A2020_066]